MSFVAKISLPGYDVGTATPEQCSIHSGYPPLKSKIQTDNPHFALLDVDFTATVTQGVEHTLYSIPHGYGYIPFTISSIDFTDNASFHYYGLGTAGVGATLVVRAYCTATDYVVTIYDDFNWTGSNARLLVSYYIFAENGT